jgi:hypothetical protein
LFLLFCSCPKAWHNLVHSSFFVSSCLSFGITVLLDRRYRSTTLGHCKSFLTAAT